jgi:hypothetical protein
MTLAAPDGTRRAEEPVDEREPIEEVEGSAVRRGHELVVVRRPQAFAETTLRACVVPRI